MKCGGMKYKAGGSKFPDLGRGVIKKSGGVKKKK